ncbi:MAG: ATP-binding protein [Actinomycetota bacterium]
MSSHTPRDFGIGRLFGAVREAIVVADSESENIVLWNEAATAIFGYPTEEAVGMPLHTLVPAELRDRHLSGLDHYRLTGHGNLMDRHSVLELPAIHKDGSRIWIEMTLTPVEHRELDQRFAMAIIRNVTDKKKLAEERDQFVAFVAHDVRSPMSVVKGITETLLERWDLLDDEKRTSSLRAVLRSADAAIASVGELVEASALEGAHFRFDIAPFDVGTLVSSIVEDVQAANPHRIFQCEMEPHLSLALGDTQRTRQVLENLLTNAIKFSPSTTPVRVSGAKVNNAIEVSVADQGSGISEENLDKIFDKFVRVSAPDEPRVSGAGIGLYTSRLLMEGQSGWLRVASNEGKGATFTFGLPISNPDIGPVDVG